MKRTSRISKSHTPLTQTKLLVSITDLVAEYELRHLFTNHLDTSIEAVYSFPVPLDSAFMGMEATLAGESLVAQVVPAQAATRQYDDAIADGNSAVLLEQLEPGMLCVNLGNLKAGEQGEIVLRFAAPLHTADGVVRFSLPLVHRPRYGRSVLDEITIPLHDFAVEHPLDATIRVNGLLAGMPVHCATHGARFAFEEGSMVLRLGQAMLDRDLVLGFELPQDLASQGRLISDGDGVIGVLSFSAPPRSGTINPTDFCLVLDGSGSMAGDAIVQSRDALRAVVQQLGDEDRIQVLRFGSSTVPMFRRPLKASARVRAALDELAITVEADLGGTDMGDALYCALNAFSGLRDRESRSKAIILVTDGAVNAGEVADAQARAMALGIRVFVVAVGSSAGANVLAPLAEGTGAVMERAVPAEPIDACVMRQFRRAREHAALEIRIDWGTEHAQALPLANIYPGDAVTAMAFLPSSMELQARVEIPGLNDSLCFLLECEEESPALRAIAGHMAYSHAPDSNKASLALRYGLIAEETSAILVKVRTEDDQAEGLPAIIPVRHMIPEGMVAMAVATSYCHDMAMYLCDMRDVPAIKAAPEGQSTVQKSLCTQGEPEYLDDSLDFLLQPRPNDCRILRALQDILIRALEGEGEFPTLEMALNELDPADLARARYLLEKLQFEPGYLNPTLRFLNAMASEGWAIRLTVDQKAALKLLLIDAGVKVVENEHEQLFGTRFAKLAKLAPTDGPGGTG